MFLVYMYVSLSVTLLLLQHDQFTICRKMVISRYLSLHKWNKKISLEVSSETIFCDGEVRVENGFTATQNKHI